MKIEDFNLEKLQELYPNNKIISLQRVYFKDYQYVSNLDDLMNNSTLVGHYYEEVYQEPAERLWNIVDDYLKTMDSNYKEDDEDYDYFEDDFMEFIEEEKTKEARKLLDLIGDETDFVRVAIISMNYKMVYTLSNEKQIDPIDSYTLLNEIYNNFCEEIDEEM